MEEQNVESSQQDKKTRSISGFPEDLFREVRRLAAKEQRRFSAEVICLLSEALKQRASQEIIGGIVVDEHSFSQLAAKMTEI